MKFIVKSETLRDTQRDTQIHTHKEKEREKLYTLYLTL